MKQLGAILAVASALALVVGCSVKTVTNSPSGAGACAAPYGGASAAPSGPVKIAGTTWLTGGSSSLGDRIKKGTDLAIKEINDKGGILGGRQVQFTFYDEGYNTDTVTTSAKKAINDGNVMLIGGWDATTCVPLAQAAKDASIPVVITSCGSEKPLDLGYPALVHMTMPWTSDVYSENGLNIMAKWLLQGYKSVAAVSTDSQFTVSVDTEWRNFFKKAAPPDFKYYDTIFFPYGQAAPKTELAKAADLKPGALFLGINGHDVIVSAVKTLRELNFKGDIVMLAYAFTQDEVNTLGTAAEGIYGGTLWQYDPSVPASKAFRDAFFAAYGSEADVWNEIAYMSAREGALALDKAGTTSDLTAIGSAMRGEDWVTPSGDKIAFDKRGRLQIGGFTIQKVVNGKLIASGTVPFSPDYGLK
jgi:branched-chain amino acid transport system substrate-binding protein